MRNLWLAFGGLTLFILGAALAPSIQWMIRSEQGMQTPECVASVCVGEGVPAAFDDPILTRQIGGFDSMTCGPSYPTYINWSDRVFSAAVPCAEHPLVVTMRSPTYQTNFEIEGGRIRKIVRYPIPQVDP